MGGLQGCNSSYFYRIATTVLQIAFSTEVRNGEMGPHVDMPIFQRELLQLFIITHMSAATLGAYCMLLICWVLMHKNPILDDMSAI